MNIEHIPEELRSSGYLVLWKEISTKDGKHRKTPIASCGRAVGYDDPEALISFSDAKNRLEKGMDIGIGITLLDGLIMQRGESEGYLNCLDFDGFADPSGVKVDPGVMRFLREFPSYTEISPSQTGFKYFFLTDRPPSTKSKIKFGPSTFLQQHPGIRKFAVWYWLSCISCNSMRF